jgi:PAS domain S-box-containing protein
VVGSRVLLVAASPPQRNLILILARNFASRLATAVFLVDAEGRVIYFNEAAERLLGQRFVEGHGMAPEEYAKLFQPTDEDGNPLPILETPLGIAITRQEPEHARLTIRGADGVTRPIEATAFPLLAHTDQRVGAIAIFWERSEIG